MMGAPGLARVAATQDVNFPRAQPGGTSVRRNVAPLQLRYSFRRPAVPPFRRYAFRRRFRDDLQLPGRRPEQPFESVGPHVHPSQLRGLDHRAHVLEPLEQPRKLLVVEHGIGFEQGKRRAETDGLAHGEPGLHPLPARERRDLPDPAAVLRREDRRGAVHEIRAAALLAAKRVERDPEAGGVLAPKQLFAGSVPELSHGIGLPPHGNRIYPEDQ